MVQKRRSPEAVIKILREADTGKSTAEICKQHGISEQTYYRWRQKYGGLEPAEAKRIKALEKENAKLKRLAGAQALIIEEFKVELKKRGWG